ncbi:MAG TPA: PDZ domain-containing protein [Candidatus Polarisedimenticolia bacterium]
MKARGTALLSLALAGAAPAADAVASPGGTGEIYETYRGNVVAITYTLRPLEKPTGGEGRKVENAICGVLVDAGGLIVTTADPFPDPGGDPRTTLAPVEFKVRLAGGRPLDAEAVGMDRDLNLAYLRLKNPPPGLRALHFSERPRLDVGDEVIVIGLMSREYDYEPILYKGIVNAVVDKPRRMYSIDLYLQDLSIGGLVISRGGEPVGIIGEDLLKETPPPDRTPSNVLSIFGSAIMGGRVGYPMIFPYPVFAGQLASPPPIEKQEKRTWLGIVMQPLNEDLIDYWKIDAAGGIIISSVVEGSPAEKAGLRQGDILVEMEGEPLRVTKDDQLADFRHRIERTGDTRPVDLAFLRRGERMRLSLTLGEAPKTAWTAEEFKDEDFGMTTREITIDDLQGQNLDATTRGVVVSELEQAGWAQLAGLQTDDIIQSVDGTETVDLASFRAHVDRLREQHPPEILFFVQRRGDTLFVLVKTSWPKAR